MSGIPCYTSGEGREEKRGADYGVSSVDTRGNGV